MPRPRKGPRLWFRPERFDKKTGKRISAGAWIIIDGSRQIGTGCAEHQVDEAERALAEYNVERYRPTRRERDIEQITVGDVLLTYDSDCRDHQANKRTFDGRLKRLNDWWGAKLLADVNGQSCRDYVKFRKKVGGARRDLEDLRAAINHHAKEGLHRGVVRVALPPKGHARDRWLTRAEAARLVWACWRHRERQRRHRGADAGKLLPTKKRPLQHVARFILIALYTGTRAGAIASASPYKDKGHSWVDLDTGLFYRLAEGRRGTNKRQPPVRLPTRLVAHMRRWKERKISTSHFIEYRGSPIKEVNNGLEHAVELAGLEGNVTPHTLRHTAATWLMINGAKMYDAAAFLGMSEETLRNVYGHHHPDYQREAAEAITRKPSPMVSPMQSPKIPASKREQTSKNIDKNSEITDT